MPDIELQLTRPPPPSRLRRGQEAGAAGNAASDARGPGHEDEIVRLVLREIAPRFRVDGEGQPGGSANARAGRSSVCGPIGVEEFAKLTIRSDCDLWSHLEEVLRTGVSVEEIHEDLLAPAARRLGAMWEADECDFLSVTTGVHRLQIAVRKLSLAFRPVREGPARALFAPAPGESHFLGLSIARAAFERRGWSTDVADGSRLYAAVRRHWFDLVAFSVSCDRLIDGLAAGTARVRRVSRNRNVFLLVGGPAVASKPELAARIAADAVVATPQEALDITRHLLRRSERRGTGGR